MAEKKWIQGAIKKPGSLRKTLGVKEGKDIPSSKLKAAEKGKYGPKAERRAHLAETLKKMRKTLILKQELWVCTEDLTGIRYGQLTVVGFSHKNEKRRTYIWKSVCDCGQFVFHERNIILSGRNKSCFSCAHLRKGMKGNCFAKKHGLTSRKGPYHPLYSLRNRIMTRCYNAKSSDYPYYQGKGIKVWKGWREDPASFYEWGMNNRWEKGLTIDRIDPNGNYEPSNCQFISLADNLKKMHREKVNNGSRDFGSPFHS